MGIYSFTDNDGLCGIPGLRTCGPHLSAGAKIGIALGACVGLLLIATCLTCWWKRRQNILRTQQIACKFATFLFFNHFNKNYIFILSLFECINWIWWTARAAPYAKARTHYSRDVQLTRHNNGHENARTVAENGPILLSWSHSSIWLLKLKNC